ncbi:hypothetical protein RJT34_33470 [Clitoria ternatea]|uniref:Uncharacterized protein n=1 Tax=Clitoria ternatea TaxID=43366 RepID=A0AAN9F090_CLITE
MYKRVNLTHSSSFMENPKKEEAVAPTRRPNFQYNGSDLYDSFEFKQMTLQLNEAIQTWKGSSPSYQEMTQKVNKVIQGSNASSPAYVFHLNSPFYRRHLNRIYRESTKTPRRISSPQLTDKRACRREIKEQSFVTRLWLKVKRGLLGKKHETEEGRNRPWKA